MTLSFYFTAQKHASPWSSTHTFETKRTKPMYDSLHLTVCVLMLAEHVSDMPHESSDNERLSISKWESLTAKHHVCKWTEEQQLTKMGLKFAVA